MVTPERVPLVRQAVRVLPISPAGEVLLLHCLNPRRPDATYWVSVGGGIEPGEDVRVAAVRELWEETAITHPPNGLLGPLHEEVVEFEWAEFDIEQHQSYYVAEVADTAVSFEHMEPIEVETTLEHRWWTLADLRSTTDYVLPNVLAVIEQVLTQRDRPVRGPR